MIDQIDHSYDITKEGEVFRTVDGKKKKLGCCKKSRYATTSIKMKNGERKTVFIHRLVAMKFLPNPNNYPVVNHKNGDIQDNCVENLEWCTQSENIKHAFSEKMRHKRADEFKTYLKVKVEKSVWYQFKLIAEHKELTKDQAFEEALSDYIRKNKKYDTMKLSEGT